MRSEYDTSNSATPRRLIASNIPHSHPQNKYGEPNSLNRLLSDSINETLTDLLGTRAREAVYDYMERNHSIARDQVPENTHLLFKLFEENFGIATSRVIGRMVAKKVYSRLDWRFQPTPNFEFSDYLERIKTRLANQALSRVE